MGLACARENVPAPHSGAPSARAYCGTVRSDRPCVVLVLNPEQCIDCSTWLQDWRGAQQRGQVVLRIVLTAQPDQAQEATMRQRRLVDVVVDSTLPHSLEGTATMVGPRHEASWDSLVRAHNAHRVLAVRDSNQLSALLLSVR